MVRVGGLGLHLRARRNPRPPDFRLKLDDGQPLEAGKSYKVAGWASVNEQQGTPIWDVFAKHLASGNIAPQHGGGITLKGVDDNPGLVTKG